MWCLNREGSWYSNFDVKWSEHFISPGVLNQGKGKDLSCRDARRRIKCFESVSLGFRCWELKNKSLVLRRVVLSQKSRNATEEAFANGSGRREECEYYDMYSFVSYSVMVNSVAVMKQYWGEVRRISTCEGRSKANSYPFGLPRRI